MGTMGATRSGLLALAILCASLCLALVDSSDAREAPHNSPGPGASGHPPGGLRREAAASIPS